MSLQTVHAGEFDCCSNFTGNFIDIYYLISLLIFSLVYVWKFKGKSKGSDGRKKAMTVAESIGYLWRLMRAENHSEETALEISRKLGKQKLFSFNFPTPMIIVNDYEMIRELQNSELWSDRPIGKVFSLRSRGQIRGLLQNNGESWKAVRKYTMKKLGQLGIGRKDRMISFLEGETAELLHHLDNLIVQTENRIPAHDLFSLSVANIVWSISTGEQFARDDPKYTALKENTAAMTGLSVSKILLMECKPLRKIVEFAPGVFGFKELFKRVDDLRVYFTEVVERKRQLKQKENECDDLIDCFLEEIEAHKDTNDEFQKNIYCIEELVAIITDLFQAGMDTTSNTLESAMMLIVKHPNIQQKIQREIYEVVGPGRTPNFFRDKQDMPYTMATISEVNRITNMVPFNGRLAKEDCTFADLKIRKGTYAFLHLHCVRMDEGFWGDPDVFRPERFLDDENNLMTDLVTHAMAFGGGKRICPGEMVAQTMLFTFFTGLLQRYNFSKADEDQILRMTDCASVTNRVHPFAFSATLRQ